MMAFENTFYHSYVPRCGTYFLFQGLNRHMKTHFLVSLSYMISATAEFHYREPLTRFDSSFFLAAD
jgi:hypothetical protein